MTTFEVHLIDRRTGAVERSIPVDTWMVALITAHIASQDGWETRITEQETK